MKVAYGTTADEVGMTNALTDHPAIQISTPADESLVFTVAADDVYYFGFNVYSIQNQNQLYLDDIRSEEHTSELQSRPHLVCRLLLEKKKNIKIFLFTCF